MLIANSNNPSNYTSVSKLSLVNGTTTTETFSFIIDMNLNKLNGKTEIKTSPVIF